jgi:hypothetical protein
MPLLSRTRLENYRTDMGRHWQQSLAFLAVKFEHERNIPIENSCEVAADAIFKVALRLYCSEVVIGVSLTV